MKSKIRMSLVRENIITVTCSYGYRLVCVDDKSNKPFKSYLGEDAVYSFMNSIIEETKYCSGVMKKYSNEELLMTKKDIVDRLRIS